MGSIADFIGILRQDVADRDARIAALESALAKAEEALKEAYQPDGSHFVGDGCSCPTCKYRRSRAALAAIKETRHD